MSFVVCTLNFIRKNTYVLSIFRTKHMNDSFVAYTSKQSRDFKTIIFSCKNQFFLQNKSRCLSATASVIIKQVVAYLSMLMKISGRA